MDAIYGMTMEMLAETMSKHGELRAQFGEQQGMVEFDRWLGGKGFNQHTWSMAHNAWHDRFKADPTGRQEAQFHMMLQQLTAKAHFGDVRDMSQDKEEGITLDQYAQITVAVSRQGADVDQIVKGFGLQDAAHWQRANAAWSAKMGQDTTHKLTMQFGQLYQKYAGPSFQQEMVDQTAGFLAEANKPRDVVDEPEEELTPDLCLQKMQSPSRNERWKYARHYAHMADLGNVPDKAAAIATVTPILIDMIEQHDEHTTSDAEDGARKLWDLGVRHDDFRGAIGRCLNRAEEKLTSLQAAFAPIQNQAVPERITLQTRIQDYQSLIGTMRDYMNEDWSSGGGGEVPSPFGAPAPAQAPGGWGGMQSSPGGSGPVGFPSMPGMSAMPGLPKMGGGFPKWIIAPIVIVLVVGGIAVSRGRAMLNSAKHEKAVASAAAQASAPAAVAAKTPEKQEEKPVEKAADKAEEPAAEAPAPVAAPKAKAGKKKKKK
ncbi:MAG: hypothetical protein KIT84_28325 [Labilithrix sp.]|nr:hypothetical protein [Labilithrix sp.]MCW5814966.1 hypothetical protein [Labilithrix sp.]